MDEKKVICDALRCWGTEHQAVVAIEEMSELQKELCKYLRGDGNVDHIAEEVADAEIMLAQMKEAFGIHEAVATHKRFKLGRLAIRIVSQRAAQNAAQESERKEKQSCRIFLNTFMRAFRQMLEPLTSTDAKAK